MSGKELAVQQAHGVDYYRASTDAASLCKQIVVASAQDIKGKKYVRVEGWQAIAIAHGCVASAGDVERTDTGYRAIGRVIKMDTGLVISQAEGFVGDDESMWASRPEYARRAMAQTRAISRACRSAFAHVVVMMNAGLSTTPAEEVPTDGFDDAPKCAPAKLAPQQAPKSTTPMTPEQVASKMGGTVEQTASAPDQKTGKKISEAQAKRLFAIAKQNKWSNDELKSHVLTFGYEHTRDILMSDYEAIVDGITAG